MSQEYQDGAVEEDVDEVVEEEVEEEEVVDEVVEDEVIECPEDLASLGELCNDKIPQTIDDLQTNVEKIEQIKEFCSGKYFAAAAEADGSPEKLAAAYEETKKYLSSAMLNVAWSIQNLTTDFTEYIALQESALDTLGLSLDALNTRLHAQYQHKGSAPLRQAEGRRGYTPRTRTRKLEGAELPELAKPFAPEEGAEGA